jgi:hypothetical protein
MVGHVQLPTEAGMKRLADLSDSELLAFKASYNKIEFNQCPGETRWCDRIHPWERLEDNIDTCVGLMFESPNISEWDRDHMRRDNPELFDLLKSTFARVSE